MDYVHNVDPSFSQDKESVWPIWQVARNKDHMVIVRYVRKGIRREVVIAWLG